MMVSRADERGDRGTLLTGPAISKGPALTIEKEKRKKLLIHISTQLHTKLFTVSKKYVWGVKVIHGALR